MLRGVPSPSPSHLAVLVPLAALLHGLRVSVRTIMIVCTLFLVSPLYVFWGRTVMIESCALFFSVSWLALLSSFIRYGGLVRFLGVLLCGSLAVLVKLTTFPAFGLLGAALFVWTALKEWREESRLNLRRMLLVAAAGILPVAIGAVWVGLTDEIRLENFFGPKLTSKALIGQFRAAGDAPNRSSLARRGLPADAPRNTRLRRRFGLLALGAWLDRRRYAALVVASVAGFLIALLIFTNLHRVHNYYQYANAIFALVALGLVIGALAENGRSKLAAFVFVMLIGGQVWYFLNNYAELVTADLARARSIRSLNWSGSTPRRTRRCSSLVGIGRRRSRLLQRAEVAGRAELGHRRSTETGSCSPGGLPWRAARSVRSSSAIPASWERAAEIEAFIAGREEIGSAGPVAPSER